MHFGDWAHVAPFVVAAGGFYRLSAGALGVTVAQNGGYFAVGGGVSILVTKHFGVRPEARLERAQLSNLLGISGTGGGGNAAVVTVGVFYQFGGN